MTPEQANRVWELKIEAEVRSYYFGDLASAYTNRKQWVVGLSFIFSSSAALTAFGSAASWIPGVCGLVAAVLAAYSIAVNLDRKAVSMARLHAEWGRLADEYEALWHTWWRDDADTRWDVLRRRDHELSEQGASDAPFDERRLRRWERFVFDREPLTAP